MSAIPLGLRKRTEPKYTKAAITCNELTSLLMLLEWVYFIFREGYRREKERKRNINV